MKKTISDKDAFNPSRRRLLAGLAASTAGAVALAACHSGANSADDGTAAASSTGGSAAPGGSSSTSGSSASGSSVAMGTATPVGSSALPDPSTTGIKQIVVVMMENRSFDHYLGWLPGADGMQAGRSFVDNKGATQTSYRLTDFQNCASAYPDHSYEGGRIELDNGTMDGFLKTTGTVPPDTFPIGYYEQADLPFHGQAAPDWTVCDRYFCSILAETYPNRFYMHSGQTSKLHNSDAPTTTTLPTIWDALKAKGVSGNYYYSDIPFVAEYGTTYLDISLPFATFLVQAASGTLPAVSYVDPSFLGEGNGVSHDDHPLADIRNGQAFMNQIYNAVTSSPQYESTLLIFNYDEWGGFAEHVVPPFAPVSAAESALGNDGRLGFRIPNIIVGPRAKRQTVDHTEFDHTSVLNLICWQFGLDSSFYPRSASSNNLALALDLVNPPNLSTPPSYTVGSGPFGTECDLSSLLPAGTGLDQIDAVSRTRAAHILDLQSLKTKAQRLGFTVY
jgi:phospholipase C